MRFPRLPWGPEVPPSDTEEGVRFTIKWGLGLAVICFGGGLVYATGLRGDDRRFGLLLLALGVAMVFWAWGLDRHRQRVYGGKADDSQPQRDGPA
jgi:hypothetical protein